MIMLVLIIAFVWLLKETNFMRVRLESTEYQRSKHNLNAKTESDYTTKFTALDMPEFTGNLNILCKKVVNYANN